MEGRTLVVDLTPVLPGGENGGAKVFVLALLRGLALAHPGARFVLLTQHAAHAELAALDAPNVRRECVVGPAAAGGRSHAFAAASRLVAAMPAPARRLAGRAGYALHRAMKRRAGGLLSRLGADLLFCPFTAPTFREAGVPLVATVYDTQFRDYPQFFAPEDAAQRERAFMEACRHATRLAAISTFSRAAALRVAPALRPERIRAIPLQVPLPAPAASSPPTWELLYPANFWRHKNHELLLAAFALALPCLPAEAKLVLTGAPGPRADWIALAAARMGLATRVEVVGFLARDAFAQRLAACRALVFPSLYEGFGIPVAEAMALGVPVACSDVTSLPEVAGDAALLFDPRRPEAVADAIVRIATDDALRERLVAAGRARARMLADMESMVGAYTALFEDALREARQ